MQLSAHRFHRQLRISKTLFYDFFRIFRQNHVIIHLFFLDQPANLLAVIHQPVIQFFPRIQRQDLHRHLLGIHKFFRKSDLIFFMQTGNGKEDLHDHDLIFIQRIMGRP